MALVTVETGPARAIPGDTTGDERPVTVEVVRTRADRAYRALALAGGALVLFVLGAIFLFLLVQAVPAWRAAGLKLFTTETWLPDSPGHQFGIPGLFLGTCQIAFVALTVAVPVSLACALFVNEYAPRWSRRALVSLVDLLAALPSLVYGLWGLIFLQPKLIPVAEWLNRNLGLIPFFGASHIEKGQGFNSSMFVAGVVVSIMVVPIITSVTREVLSQVPRETCEAALALGGTRWGMIRDVVLPFGRGGIVGACMLGLGRALGETIAVALILSADFRVTTHVLVPGGGSLAALIVVKFGEAQELGRHALVAAGLILFLLTLAVNMAARLVVHRSARAQAAAS